VGSDPGDMAFRGQTPVMRCIKVARTASLIDFKVSRFIDKDSTFQRVSKPIQFVLSNLMPADLSSYFLFMYTPTTES